jgi:hypothetical protein
MKRKENGNKKKECKGRRLNKGWGEVVVGGGRAG